MERHSHPRTFLAVKTVRYLVVLFVIVTLNFLIPRLMPGDPLMNLVGEEAYYSAGGALDAFREEMGLNQPLPGQYINYLGDLVRGDWGYSYLYLRPVSDAIVIHLGWSLVLILPAILLSALMGAISGSIAAARHGSRLDAGLTGGFLLAYSMPHYWLAMILLFVFAFLLGWFPLGKATSGGLSGVALVLDIGWHMLLPLLVLTLSKTAYDHLIVRNSVISIYGEDYILTAQSRGLSSSAVLFKHALRNSLAPLVTVTALQFGAIFSGALMVEVVFSWPGMGMLIYGAIGARDYPLLQYAFFIIAVCVLLANLAADLIYAWLDPRTR